MLFVIFAIYPDPGGPQLKMFLPIPPKTIEAFSKSLDSHLPQASHEPELVALVELEDLVQLVQPRPCSITKTCLKRCSASPTAAIRSISACLSALKSHSERIVLVNPQFWPLVMGFYCSNHFM